MAHARLDADGGICSWASGAGCRCRAFTLFRLLAPYYTPVRYLSTSRIGRDPRALETLLESLASHYFPFPLCRLCA